MTCPYETLSAREGDTVKQFEIKRGANEAHLTRHPGTGEPIRRVTLGGWGITPSTTGGEGSPPAGCGCGPGGRCRSKASLPPPRIIVFPPGHRR